MGAAVTLTVHAGLSHPPSPPYPLWLRAIPKQPNEGLAKIYIFCTQETWQCAGIVHAGLPDLGERLPAKSNDPQSEPGGAQNRVGKVSAGPS